MSSQSSFPGGSSWGRPKWDSPRSEQPAKPIDVGGNHLPGIDWRDCEIDPDEFHDPDELSRWDHWRRLKDTYMRSPEWKRNRQPALDRAYIKSLNLYACEHCHKLFTSLEGHHLTYERLGHELPEDILAVCLTCHAELDEQRRQAEEATLRAIREQWETEREEREAQREDQWFHNWVRKRTGLDPSDLSEDELDDLKEEFAQWRALRDE